MVLDFLVAASGVGGLLGLVLGFVPGLLVLGLLVLGGLVLGLLILGGLVLGLVGLVLSVATLGGLDVGNEAVAVVAVVDGLDAAVGEGDVVRAGDSLAVALLLVAQVDVGVVVLHIISEAVGAGGLHRR